MSEEEIKKMVEETSISDDPFVVVPALIIIKKIINLADNAETTIDNLLLDTIFEGEKFEIDTQEKIYEIVFNVCKRINIKLEKANYEERFVGLPFKYAIKKVKINNDRFTYQEGDIQFKENKMNNTIDEKVQEFARQQGYQKAVYLNEWNGYKCYEPIFDESKPSFTGLPLIILVDSNNNIRMSTSDEAVQQMRETNKNDD